MKQLVKLFSLFFIMTGSLVLRKTLSGTVSDTEGLPLPGATVVAKTSIGVTSDLMEITP